MSDVLSVILSPLRLNLTFITVIITEVSNTTVSLVTDSRVVIYRHLNIVANYRLIIIIKQFIDSYVSFHAEKNN